MKLTKIWFADNRIYGLTDQGNTVWQSLLWYKRLLNATEEQRNEYKMDDEGIHWNALDEDVSFESFEYDNPEPVGVSKLFLTHPEVNPLAVAKRLGINPGLMTHYINGTRKPSKDCESKIYNEIKVIGESLAAIGS